MTRGGRGIAPYWPLMRSERAVSRTISPSYRVLLVAFSSRNMSLNVTLREMAGACSANADRMAYGERVLRRKTISRGAMIQLRGTA